jgi:hypothetical protein
MKEGKYTEVICSNFCRFYKEGKEELQCGAYMFLKKCFSPDEIAVFVQNIDAGPLFMFDDFIRELICERCEFLTDGCDYREGLESPPCGGYAVIEHMVRRGIIGT